jgi:hypothetical protein
LDHETLMKVMEDCNDFQENQKNFLEAAYCQNGYNDSDAGHDFWLTRNGHGAGFWDRGLGVTGQLLSEAARIYGGVDWEVGGDGKVHQIGV